LRWPIEFDPKRVLDLDKWVMGVDEGVKIPDLEDLPTANLEDDKIIDHEDNLPAD
jgi:hypothetical protein